MFHLYLDAKTLIKYYIENQAINCELNVSQDATRNLDASVTYIKQSNYSLCLLSTMLPTLPMDNTNMFNFVHLELSMFYFLLKTSIDYLLVYYLTGINQWAVVHKEFCHHKIRMILSLQCQ